MRALRFLFPLLFAGATIVQFNDPDALRWVAFYGLATGVSAWGIFGAPARMLALVLALWALVWAGSLVPGVLATGQFTFDEEQRELGGLLIAVLVLGGQALRFRAPAAREANA